MNHSPTPRTFRGASAICAALLLSAMMLPAAFAQSAASGARIEGNSTPPAAAEQVIVSGQVSDEATRMTVLTELRQVYGAANVVDRIEITNAVGTPTNWAANIQKLLTPTLRQIHRGQMQIDGTQIAVTGEVGNEALRQKVISDMAAALNPTYTIKNGLRVPVQEQAVLDNALANRIIEFEAGSATLTPKGQAVLDALIPVLSKLVNKSVTVIGHTDNSGNRVANLALSRARADTVKGYLVNKGMDPANISTSGVGPDQPVASNDTYEGRSRNRRIEFRLNKPG
ncbi:MAG: OmpA family protein [Burkholderiaceae bacterium]|nr:OmpA family protein [Burkholderiaceae bacterium]